MPVINVRYTLPDDQHDYDAARLGPSMLSTLSLIDQRLRSLIKHGEPSNEERVLAQEIRDMIRIGCPELWDI